MHGRGRDRGAGHGHVLTSGRLPLIFLARAYLKEGVGAFNFVGGAFSSGSQQHGPVRELGGDDKMQMDAVLLWLPCEK